MEIKTDLGKIYCKYNEEIDDFDKIRLIDIDPETGDHTFMRLDKDSHILNTEADIMIMEPEDYDDIKKNWVLLRSEGIISKTDIIAMKREDGSDLEDVLLMYFANNKITKVPDIQAPYIVARQGINNIFAEMAGQHDQIGMSVSLETLPPNYALIDFMSNEGTLSTRLIHVYKTDTAKEINMVLMSSDQENTEKIFQRFYNNRIRFLKNTRPNFDYIPKDHDCIDGHCSDLETFLEESDFMNDIYSTMGIIRIDKEFKQDEPLDDDDRLLIATICGGIRIKKAVPLAFAYDINMEAIKMKYVLVLDSKNKLWIVYYIEANEVPVEELYNLTEERTKLLQERMLKCIKTYDISTKAEAQTDNIIDISNIKPSTKNYHLN